MPGFRHQFEKTIAQDFTGTEFPFIWLDPEYCWHGGFRWWESKLRPILRIIAENKLRGNYLSALRSLSKRLAAVELVPYHSSTFKAHRLIEDLPSVHAARIFVQDILMQADKTVIVTRQVEAWKLPKGLPNLISYGRGLARGASLGPDTPGGRAILAQYGISIAPN